MDYLHINANSADGQRAPVVMKVSKKAWGLCGRMGKLAKQHIKLERELLTELAEINNMVKKKPLILENYKKDNMNLPGGLLKNLLNYVIYKVM